jgi:hypothetical protein
MRKPQNPTGRWAARPRVQLALRRLKQIRVKGGCEWRLHRAPMYGRQLALFLAA